MICALTVVGEGEEARGATGATAPPDAIAQQAIEEARAAEASGHKREAIQGYKRAYELSGDPSLLFQLGELSRELGETSAAGRFYRAYLARDRHGKHRADAERAVSSLEREDVDPATSGGPSSRPPPEATAHDAPPVAEPSLEQPPGPRPPL